jgi:ABC-type Mn2+/Zn2+ transport system ATPase subunit
MTEDSLISLQGVEFGYGRSVVVKKVDLDIRPGVFLGLVGPNGAGKTTMLRTLLGLLKPISGRLLYKPRLSLGYVPQRGRLDPLFPLTVYELVLMGRFPKLRRWGWWRRKSDPQTLSVLARCGLAELVDQPFRELSGGQKQRCLIARTLVSDPELLVLDEPTNNMDLRGEHEIMELLRSLHQSGKSILMVSHRLDVLLNAVTDLAIINDAILSSGPLEDMLNDDRLSKLFGLPLHLLDLKGHLFVRTSERGHA